MHLTALYSKALMLKTASEERNLFAVQKALGVLGNGQLVKTSIERLRGTA